MIWLFGKGQHAVVLEAVVLENVALRQQIAVYKRKQKHSRLARRDRWFWIVLSVTWKDWRRALCIVHPDTVVCLATRAFPSVLGKPVEEVGNSGTTTGQP